MACIVNEKDLALAIIAEVVLSARTKAIEGLSGRVFQIMNNAGIEQDPSFISNRLEPMIVDINDFLNNNGFGEYVIKYYNQSTRSNELASFGMGGNAGGTILTSEDISIGNTLEEFVANAPIDNVSITKLFGGSLLIKDQTLNLLERQIFNSVVFSRDVNNPVILAGGQELNDSLRNFRNQVGASLSKHHVNGRVPTIEEFLEANKTAINSNNDNLTLDIYKEYGNVVIYNRFDELVEYITNKEIKVLPGLRNIYDYAPTVAKYSKGSDNKLRTNWTDISVINYDTEVSSYFKIMIKQIPMKNARTGQILNDRYLNHYHVYNAVKFLKGINKYSQMSNKDAIEKFLNEEDVHTIQGSTLDYYNILRSYNDYVYNDSNSLANITKQLNDTGKYSSTLLELVEASLDELNVVEYAQVLYDWNEKALVYTTATSSRNTQIQSNIIKEFAVAALNFYSLNSGKLNKAGDELNISDKFSIKYVVGANGVIEPEILYNGKTINVLEDATTEKSVKNNNIQIEETLRFFSKVMGETDYMSFAGNQDIMVEALANHQDTRNMSPQAMMIIAAQSVVQSALRGSFQTKTGKLGNIFDDSGKGHILRAFIRVKNVMTGEVLKTTVRSVEREMLPTFGLPNVINSLYHVYGDNKLIMEAQDTDLNKTSKEIGYLDTTRTNLFRTEFDRGNNLAKDMIVRNGLKSMTTYATNPSMSFVETFKFNFDFGFMKNLMNSNSRYDIDFTTFSDKSRNTLLSFTADTSVNVKNTPTRLLSMSNDDLIGLLDDTYGEAVRSMAVNVHNALQHAKLINDSKRGLNEFSIVLQNLRAFHNTLVSDEGKENKATAQAKKALDAANIEYDSAIFFDRDGLNSTLLQDVETIHRDKAGLASYLNKMLDQAADNLINEGYKMTFTKKEIDAFVDRAFKDVDKENVKKQLDTFKRGNYYVLRNSKNEINPIFSKYLLLTNVISQNMQHIGVGTIYGHGGKNRADRFVKMVKRMVSWQATYHNYHIGREKGVDHFTKVLHVSDPDIVLPTINGKEAEWPHTDGASETLFLQRILENNSLPASGGIHHKSILMTSDPRFGVAGLTKHAAFAITNERLRETSEFKGNRNYRAIVKNMMNFDISNVGNLLDLKYGKLPHKVHHVLPSGVVAEREISYLEGNRYEIRDITGPVSKSIVEVNTLYDAYQMLGGWNTVSLVDRPSPFKYYDNFYEYSESSWYNLVDIVTTNKDANVTKKLRDSFIGRIDFTKSIKVGIKNTVKWEELSDDRGASYFSNKIIKVSNRNAGIQLNAEHHIEDSELSLPTQVLSSLIFNSKTVNEALAAFNAINTYTRVAIDEFSKGTDLSAEDRKLLIGKVNDIFKADGTSDDALSAINEVVELLKSGVITSIPGHEASIQTKLKNTLVNYFVKTGIRAKMAGIMGVLSPSETVMELYHVPGDIYNKVAPTVGLTPTKEERVTLRHSEYQKFLNGAKTLPGFVASSVGKYKIKTPAGRTEVNTPGLQYENFFVVKGHTNDLRMYDHVVTADNQIIEVLDFETYYKLKNLNQELQFVHGIPSGLRGGDIVFNINNGTGDIKMSLYDTAEVQALSALEKMLDSKNPATGKKDFTHKDLYTGRVGGFLSNLNYISDDAKKVIYDSINEVKTKFGDTWHDLPGIQATTIIQDIIKTKMDRTVNNLKNGTYVHNGVAYSVNGYKVKEYQVGMPNIHYEKLGLSRNDTVNAISAELIEKRYRQKFEKILDIKGKMYFDPSNKEGHIYFTADKDILNKAGIVPYKIWIKQGDKRMLLDDKGDMVGALPEGVEVYRYKDSIIFYTPEPKNVETMIQTIGESIDDNHSGLYGKLREAVKVDDLYDTHTAKKDMAKYNDKIKKDSEAMFVSFKQTLKYTMARIPAQAFQSYTGVKAAYFIESEENTLTVAPAILMYSGADMDIDKAFCVGFGLDNKGKFHRWTNSHVLKEDFFEVGLALPVPDKFKEVHYTPTGIPLVPGLEKVVDHKDLFKVLNSMDINSYKLYVAAIQDAYEGQAMSQAWEPILKIYNSQSVSLDAIKNFVAYSVNQVINDPGNIRYAQTAIDPDVVSGLIDEKNNPKMAENKKLDPMDPTSIIKQKIANMVGKEVIGIVASSIKVFSALTTSYNTVLKKKNRTAAEVAALLLKPVRMNNSYEMYNQPDKGPMFAILTNIDPTEYIPMVQETIEKFKLEIGESYKFDMVTAAKQVVLGDMKMEDYKGDINNFILAKLEILQEQFIFAKDNRDLFEHDGSIYLSSFLTLATDNAKELKLFPLNAGPDTASFYTYGLMLGIPMHSLVSFMTSNAISLVTEAGKPDRFTTGSSDLSIRKGFNTWSRGLDVRPFGREFYMFSNPWANEEIDPEYDNSVVLGSEFLPRLNELKTRMEALGVNFEGTEGFNIKTKFGPIKNVFSFFQFMLLNNVNVTARDGQVHSFYIHSSEIEQELEKMIATLNQAGGEINSGVQEFYEKLIYLKQSNERQSKDGAMPLEWTLDNNGLLSNDVMESFDSITQGTNQATALSSVLKINQGITTHAYDLYKYQVAINTAFSGGDYSHKGLRNFLSGDESAASVMKKASMEFINIPAIINNNPSFNGQLSVLGSYENTMDVISKFPDIIGLIHTKPILESPVVSELNAQANKDKKVGFVYDKEDKLVSFMDTDWSGKVLTEAGYAGLTDYLNDLMSIEYLKNTANLELSPKPDGKSVKLNLGQYEDRKVFISWFNRIFIPVLKQQYGNEALVKGLTNDTVTDKVTGYESVIIKPTVDMTNLDAPQVQSTIAAMQSSFRRIGNHNVHGIKIKDAMFYYNLIVNKNRSKKGALTRIINTTLALEASNKKSNIYSDYINYINELSNADLEALFNKVDIRDFVMYGIMPKVNYYSEAKMYVTQREDGTLQFNSNTKEKGLSDWLTANIDNSLQTIFMPIHGTITQTNTQDAYAEVFKDYSPLDKIKSVTYTIDDNDC